MDGLGMIGQQMAQDIFFLPPGHVGDFWGSKYPLNAVFSQASVPCFGINLKGIPQRAVHVENDAINYIHPWQSIISLGVHPFLYTDAMPRYNNSRHKSMVH